jgi:hypothetical protein
MEQHSLFLIVKRDLDCPLLNHEFLAVIGGYLCAFNIVLFAISNPKVEN